MIIKTRFAPSPTGYLHIGGVRTALYSWLFARKYGGKFLLRIEDTDFTRSLPKAVESIIDSMYWLNLEWDEGPYFQTKRFDRYNIIINNMLSAGTAYKCFCSKERLISLRKEQIARGEKPRYDYRCRYDRTRHHDNEPYVIRFANPLDGSIIFHDQIRGLIKFNNKELDDLVIRRSDGYPTYNFCTVVDDLDMKISHVIRGEEHLNNTPRQINILKALGAPIPIYAHVSMIHGSDRKKFSKRHGAINVMQYRDDGYLPEAILNYLVRLGWSHGNQEIFNRDEMIQLFSLSTMNKSTSIFDIKKLLWLNHYYINTLPVERVALQLKRNIEQIGIDIRNGPALTTLVQLFGTRCKTLKEIAENCRYFYEEFDEFNIDASRKYLCLSARQPLETIRNYLSTIDEWTIENIRYSICAAANDLSVKRSEIGMPLRVAITGVCRTPALYVTVYTIGKSRCIARINKALSFILKQGNI